VNDESYHQWCRRLRSEDEYIRIEAAENPPDGLPEIIVSKLIQALSDDDPLVRVSAAESLGTYDTRESRRALLDAIECETDELVLGYAVSSLGLIAEIDDIPLISRQIKHRTKDVARVHSVLGLFFAGRCVAKELLCDLLEDKSISVRICAANALALVCASDRDEDVLAALRARIATEDTGIAENLKEALAKIEDA